MTSDLADRSQSGKKHSCDYATYCANKIPVLSEAFNKSATDLKYITVTS